ncbi:PREDICTED: platelet glycoprotein V-like [Polistes dominula]|uniref:Platelet glycoprotein V-like n=1 Tax=Polistes dominula TaxID=743375 RepID=A0ABM1JB72_POLDO|nr:PREDICTED: platelet glycoprotein V-like [Polistes dominula]
MVKGSGIIEKNRLSFQSYKNLSNSLKKEHFEGFSNVKKLILSHNGLTNISSDFFRNFPNLRLLDLSENYLVLSKDTFNETWNLDKLLPLELFQNNKKLKRVSFTNNKALLPTLTGDLLTDLENLEIIHLEGNRFRSLPENLFWGSTSLKYIDLNENSLEELPELIFFELIEIEYLLLSRNLIKMLPDEIFKYLKYLEVLDLSYNRIVYVQRILLEGLTSLRELNMEGNRLIYIHSEAFADDFVFTSNNFVADLRHNNIKKFLLTNIEELAIYITEKRHVIVHVENNPLSCDCSLYDVVRYLNDDMPITVYNFLEITLGNLKCVKPNGILGPRIRKLDFKKYPCPEDEFFKIDKKCQTMCICTIRPLPKTIQVLELHNNRLSRMSPRVSEFLLNQNYKELTLSGNPFICDCNAKFLYAIVLKKQDTYKDLKNVKCKGQNITLVDMTIKQLCPSNVSPEKIIKTVE